MQGSMLNRPRKARARRRSQTATEYVFLIAGALMFVMFAFLVIRGGLFTSGAHKIGTETNSLANESLHPYLCWDNFDAEVLDN
ncbi:MAG: hypothetical protein V1787_03680, partial [Candidatus Micrarchaeota archaeon]